MTVRIERTDGLVLMSPEELHAEAARQDGEIVIRLSAEALKKPGAFFRIQSAPVGDDFPLGKACDLSGEGTCEACQ